MGARKERSKKRLELLLVGRLGSGKADVTMNPLGVRWVSRFPRGYSGTDKARVFLKLPKSTPKLFPKFRDAGS